MTRLVLAVGGTIAIMLVARVAEACGCFTPPDPSVPIVQAGERIVFSRQDGVVTAHIQIQYAGDAKDFGWLLPLPSIPTLELGTDELFTQLIRTTQPQYRLTRRYEGQCFGSATVDDARSPDARPPDAGTASPGGGTVVVEASIGPYDYAVLKADSKDEMLAWLRDNRYFVPAGTDDVVGPYIRRGSFFLALKLKSGESVGTLQPVVVRYASDLPMIPIILTSVAAQPDMGIQVWMLGEGRAIPRNYAHTVLNDAKIDWLSNGRNYNDVVIAATKEAPGRHAFVTEYAGSSAIMQRVLDPEGRFGSMTELAALSDPLAFLIYVNTRGYARVSMPFPFGPRQLAYSTQLLAILQKYLPKPDGVPATAAQFYAGIDYWLGTYRQNYPSVFAGWPAAFDPAAAAAELDERIAKPTLAAGAMFREHPYLTRLYTTLSPEHMNRDPVFSENPGLPEYSNVHDGLITFHCGTQLLSAKTPATLVTADGWTIRYPDGVGLTTVPAVALPWSRRIEIVLEEGLPAAMTDNAQVIGAALASIRAIPDPVGPLPGPGPDAGVPLGTGNGGCAAGGGSAPLWASLLTLLLLLRALRSDPSSRA